jgi:hypothetical protein
MLENLVHVDVVSLTPQVVIKVWNKWRFRQDNIQILFIDDTEMPVVQNLKKTGWIVEKIKDVKNLDDAIVKRSHIIFVDFKGVGRNISPQHEGIGLAIQLKKKYQKKKRIILYSANSSFSADSILKSDFDYIDNRILKNADTTEFVDMINSEMKKLI